MPLISKITRFLSKLCHSWKLPVFGFGMALILTVWSAIALQIFSGQRSMNRLIAQETANLALVFEQSTDRTASEIDRILKYLRASYERQGSAADWPKLVQEEFTFNRRTVQIAIIDANGMMITSTKMLYPQRPVDLSDREHYKVHAKANVDRLFISKPLVGRASKQWSVQFTRPFRDAGGAFAGVIVVSLDPQYLTRSFGSLDIGSHGGLAIVGDDGLVRAGAGIYEHLLGKPLPDDAIGGDESEIATGVPTSVRYTKAGPVITSIRDSKDFPLRAVITRSDPPQYTAWVMSRRNYVLIGCVVTLLVVLVMIASIIRQRGYERRLSYLASHDSLTELLNRSEFSGRLTELVDRPGRFPPFAVHLVDLDDFKAINDTYGHPIGDSVLIEVGQRLVRNVRAGDMVARLGGDEFAVIQRGATSAESAAALAERLCIELSKPYDIDGVRIESGASVGIVLGSADFDDEDHLMRSADLALYAAKNAGGSTFRFFDERMNQEAQARREIEFGLREAIDHGNLEVHYQPIHRIADSSITGVEALIRWRHPVKGLISPGAFIPVAEQTGLIVEIGAWVMRRACTDIAGQAPQLNVAVNVSAVEFRDSNVAATVRAAIEASNLAPERLKIEITESLLMKRDALTMRQLDELRALGVRISLDDFGTGYSSLSYLQSYPTDLIKIDQSFVRALGQIDRSKPIVEAIVALARCLGMRTVAEGVETEEQLAILAGIGCGEAQGYLFSKPLPLNALLEWIAEQKPRQVFDAA